MISGKLGGVRAKTWVKLQLFLNNSGPRVESGKSQGLFSKKFRPNRYLRLRAVRSGSGGLDLNAGRSNLSHRKRIRRPGRFGRVGAARLAGNASTAAAHRRRSPNPAFPGRIRAGLGSRSTYEACIGHWCAQARGFGARDMGLAAQAVNLAGARRAGSSGEG